MKETHSGTNRRALLKSAVVAAGATAFGVGFLAGGIPAFGAEGQRERRGRLRGSDANILRFLAAAEILETDLWQQYAEFAGTQNAELPGLTGGSPLYTEALKRLDEDMDQYISDNTEDELTHEQFINAYLASKGADIVDLSPFATLPSSRATGAQDIGRLTNLMQLTVDTTWQPRYRSRTKNPDLGDTFPNAIPSLAVGRHTAIPRTDDDVKPDFRKPNNISDFTQAIANTAAYHFAAIEQGGISLYPMLAQRVTDAEVLRILLSIGGTEIAHFQTWHDKAGNAPHLTDVIDPITGVSVTFPDLNAPPFGGEDFQTNLIMPEPTFFLNPSLGPCSIIRPTETKGAAVGALKSLTDSGLFLGQSPEFFAFMKHLAKEADEARRHF